MAKNPTPEPAPASRWRLPQSRKGIVAFGALVGLLWGGFMWSVATLLGQDSGLRGLIYLAVTMAMMGTGVGAFFGALGVRQRGERISPRIRRKR